MRGVGQTEDATGQRREASRNATGSVSFLWSLATHLLSLQSAVIVIVLGGCVGTAGAAETESKDANYYELMKMFVDTFEQIDRNYVKEVDRRELIEAAMRGMIAKLDPYSSYIDPDELERFNQRRGAGIRRHRHSGDHRRSKADN